MKTSAVGDEEPFDWLFLDLNSYFASVEQQEHPEARGRPTVVVPVMTPYTCAIAASYEAKALGIKTGTSIAEALEKCPGLIRFLARHDLYVEYHHRIIEEVERHLPVHQVASIDEMACRLTGRLRQQRAALELALRIKEGLRRRVGECIRCSIGISTNRYLAKVATDLEKPDGLVALHPSELPGALLGMKLRDFPGIGASMEVRLHRAGIRSVRQLWACEGKQLRAIWGSVAGERFWHALRGVEIPDDETKRSTVGHSHVLDPEQRAPKLAEAVGRRLLLKAATRLRAMHYLACELTLSIRLEHGRRLETATRLPAVSDSLTLQEAFSLLWFQMIQQTGDARIKKISVTLHRLVARDEAARQMEFLPLAESGEFQSADSQSRRDRISQIMDELTERYGRDSVTVGIMPGQGSSFTGTKIAFTRIPKNKEFD